jgi:hypothetical protein
LFADFHALPPADNVSSSPVLVISAFRNVAQIASHCLLTGGLARGPYDPLLIRKWGKPGVNKSLYSVAVVE